MDQCSEVCGALFFLSTRVCVCLCATPSLLLPQKSNTTRPPPLLPKEGGVGLIVSSCCQSPIGIYSPPFLVQVVHENGGRSPINIFGTSSLTPIESQRLALLWRGFLCLSLSLFWLPFVCVTRSRAKKSCTGGFCRLEWFCHWKKNAAAHPKPVVQITTSSQQFPTTPRRRRRRFLLQQGECPKTSRFCTTQTIQETLVQNTHARNTTTTTTAARSGQTISLSGAFPRTFFLSCNGRFDCRPPHPAMEAITFGSPHTQTASYAAGHALSRVVLQGLWVFSLGWFESAPGVYVVVVDAVERVTSLLKAVKLNRPVVSIP